MIHRNLKSQTGSVHNSLMAASSLSSGSATTLWLATLAINQLAFGMLMVRVSGIRDFQAGQSQLVDRCCQVGTARAAESSSFQCKLSAREALAGSGDLVILVGRYSTLADQCEMALQSCCVGQHRKRNCDSGKQLAHGGSSCMDVELSKEATVATESFNDCCMACSLGVLEARNLANNDTQSRTARPSELRNKCRLPQPLAGSHAGQLYEDTFTECCLENLPRRSSGLLEPGAPVDCAHANPCSQRCVSGPAQFDPVTRRRIAGDRCDCFSGYRLSQDGVTCVDVDECKTGQHTCASDSQICDNIPGSFRCLIRSQAEPSDGGGNEGSDAASSSLEPSSFNPLRLCPLGSRWNSRENRCTQSGGSSSFSSTSSSSSSSSSRSTRRSGSLSSLLSSTRLGLGLNNYQDYDNNNNYHHGHERDDELAELH